MVTPSVSFMEINYVGYISPFWVKTDLHPRVYVQSKMRVRCSMKLHSDPGNSKGPTVPFATIG